MNDRVQEIKGEVVKFSIAIVWNATARLVDITTRIEPYVEGFREFGIDAVTVCLKGTELGYKEPFRLFESEDELTTKEYWSGSGFKVLLIFTWHKMTSIMKAAKEAGLYVFEICESDGQVSPKYHAWEVFQFMTIFHKNWFKKLGATKFWIKRFLKSNVEHQILKDNLNVSDTISFAGKGGCLKYAELLNKLGMEQYKEKIAWVPYPIPSYFCEGVPPNQREKRIIAIGRWESPQKNIDLLYKTIQTSINLNFGIEFLIIGEVCHEPLQKLAKVSDKIKLLGKVDRETVKQLMLQSRSILITSRWESGPLVAWEMLSCGGTIIGSPIVNLVEISKQGPFGTIAKNHCPFKLADAIKTEMDCWDNNLRLPSEISTFWRKVSSPHGVCQKILNLINSGLTQLPG